MSDPTPLRAAVIGCGPIGSMHAAAISANPHSNLVAVCDVDPTVAEAKAKTYGVPAFTDYRQVFSQLELDVATIATPNHLHVEPCRTALLSGCHVFSEKPLATNLAEAIELQRLSEAENLQLAVNYNRRFGFGYQRAEEWLNGGKIGRLRQLTFHVSDGDPRPHVATEPAVMLSAVLVHHFDLVRWLGGEVSRVSCHAADRDATLIRNFSVQLELANGLLAIISAIYRTGQHRTVEHAILDGDQGEIRVHDVTRSATLRGLDPDDHLTVQRNHFKAGDRFYDTIPQHLDSFLGRLVAGEPVHASARDGVMGLAIGAAARRSLEEERRVRLDEVLPTTGE